MPVGLSHMFNDETWFCVGLVGKLHVAPFGRKLIYIYFFQLMFLFSLLPLKSLNSSSFICAKECFYLVVSL